MMIVMKPTATITSTPIKGPTYGAKFSTAASNPPPAGGVSAWAARRICPVAPPAPPVKSAAVKKLFITDRRLRRERMMLFRFVWSEFVIQLVFVRILAFGRLNSSLAS